VHSPQALLNEIQQSVNNEEQKKYATECPQIFYKLTNKTEFGIVTAETAPKQRTIMQDMYRIAIQKCYYIGFSKGIF
jgi:hypothetical protein